VLRAGLTYVGLCIVALIFLGPFVMMISVSFQPTLQFLTFPIDIVPPHPSLDAYIGLFANSPIARWILNSTVISVLGRALNLFASWRAGYAFARG